MNPRLQALRTWAGKNRVVLGGGAAALVVGVAVLRSRKGGGSGAAASTTTGGASPNGQLAGVNGAAYDSTDSDVYNAIQPQIESVRDLLLKIQDGNLVSTIPTPALPGGATSETQPTVEQAAPTLDRISTNWGSSSGSIYNGQLSDGRTVAINQNDVWSGTFSGSGAAGGYNAAEADQIRTALQNKGLLSTSADAAREIAERAKGF